ncbi:MAG: restriction endonuclease subunit S [Candidatus Omnitrophica bacterium]|nr:restriction endonuclease subunit S [Candidatus Omnitrophota bacterium]
MEEVKEKEKLPEGWEKAKMGEIIKENKKSPFKVEDADKEGMYPFFTSGDTILSHSSFLVDGENLFLSTGGKAYVSYYKGKASYSADTYSIKSKINARLLFYIISRKIDYITFKFFIGSGLEHLQKNDFKSNFEINFPNFQEEQQKIAEILETIDNAIEKTDQIIEKYKRIKQGLMQELFTKGVIDGFMFDTNIFDAILDNKIDLRDLPAGFNYYITHIQKDELEAINKSGKLERKYDLIEIFNELEKEELPTEGFVLGVSRLGQAKLSSDDLYDKLLNRLQELDKKAGKSKTKENQIKDVLIAKTCIKNALILVSNDENLRIVTQEFGGAAISFEDLLNGRYRKFKPSPLGRIPEEWKVVELGEVSSITMGQSPDSFLINKERKGVPFLQGNAEFTSRYPNPVNWIEKPLKVSEKDSILISVRAPVGALNLADKRYCIGRGLASIKANNNLMTTIFLWYSIHFFINELIKFGQGSTFEAIGRDELQSLRIFLPPLPEQKRIVSILSQIDEVIEREQKYKQKLERIKQGLMEDLLTGKVRINCLIEEVTTR